MKFLPSRIKPSTISSLDGFLDLNPAFASWHRVSGSPINGALLTSLELCIPARS